MRALIERRPTLLGSLLAVAPLVVALVAMRWRPWAPVLDMAMTELRVRDVGGRFTPRIGLPGRIGRFPDQGSHPGPWSFYVLAPFYRLAGATAWGMQLGSVAINGLAAVGTVAVGRRIGGSAGAICLAALVAVTIRGLGLNVLTHPWNPYFPLLLWLLLLVAAWAVVAGAHRLAVVVAVCASVAAQTHVPYLVSCVFVAALVLAVLLARLRRAEGDERRAVGRSTAVALGVTALLWIPPVADQVRRDPGNMTMLWRHFTGEPTEPSISLRTTLSVFFRHLDGVGAAVDVITRPDGFVHRSGLHSTPASSVVGGVAVLLAWVAAATIAHRRGHHLLRALNAVLAVALLAELVSISRIFGKVWFYLTLWAWPTMLLVVASIAWTGVLVARDHTSRSPSRSTLMSAAAIVASVATALSLVAVADQEVPEPNLSEGLRAVVGPTTAALRDGVGAAVGPDGRYLVFWQDSVFIGAQGYGLVNELERGGLDVGVHATWRVPVTHHRVMPPGTHDAEVHLVSGVYIDAWRERAGHVEVATVDVRTGEERARFAVLRERVGRRLDELGRSELVELVDGNLFGASLDPDLPPDVIDDLSEMLLLGEPVSVFIAPPGSSF